MKVLRATFRAGWNYIFAIYIFLGMAPNSKVNGFDSHSGAKPISVFCLINYGTLSIEWYGTRVFEVGNLQKIQMTEYRSS